jgi:intracellular sulfur oxidation DsrE/DsrF family protein
MESEMIDDQPGTPRRTFIGQLAATAVGLGAAACAPSASAAAAAGAAPVRAQGQAFDDSWTRRLGSQHRFVFEAAQMANGPTATDQVATLFDWYHASLATRDQDMHLVLVVRHAAIPMVFNDALWSKYSIGEDVALKNPAGEFLKANPYTSKNARERGGVVPAAHAIDALQQRGVIVLACNMAAMFRAASYARKTKADVKAVEQEVRDNLLPGVILQVNGIYAVARAEDAGCTYYRGG